MLCQSSDGSILDLLKKRGWGYEINCGVSGLYSGFTLYGITLILTPQGRENIKDIIELVLQAIVFIEKNGINENYFQEVNVHLAATDDQVKQIMKMQWISDMHDEPVIQAQRIAELMQHHYKYDNVLGLDLVLEYHPHAIQNIISQMTLDNLR
ncbi:hypothetical protein DSO57_1026327 [Entomophthora muscae]|uniref:Uncharacterized protein n=2 Tax=Entomophthora muscae TaxID=34485 RepID=A0ACC2UMD3_9FUNG|nr:hypothetical protein DSO57_1029969 [Entomophthora muscae]KAJ9088102.1 hypothetical protein DSO57_1026327 [Entomophthora muscae]